MKRGLPEEILRRYPADLDKVGHALVALGRLDEAIALSQHDEWVKAYVLMMAGRAGEIPRSSDRHLDLQIAMAQGDGELALSYTEPFDPERHSVRYFIGLRRWIAGDRAGAEAFFEPEPLPEGWQGWPYHRFLGPFLHDLAGARGELDAACAETIAHERFLDEQHDWYCARCLTGAVGDAEFLAQPHNAWAEAALHRCKGMRAERAERAAEAIAEYRAYLDLPLWRRDEKIDPIWDAFVQWRHDELARAVPK